MTATGRQDAVERDIARWFGETREAVPDALLDATMARVARTRQRPRPLARIGAPTPAMTTAGRLPSIRYLIPVVVALGVALGVLAVGVSTEPRVVVMPSATPRRPPSAPTAGPSASASTPSSTPEPTRSPASSATAADPDVVSGAGLTIRLPDGWHRTQGYVGSGLLQMARRPTGGLVGDVVGVTWGTADEPLSINLGQQAGAVTVSGHDLASLLASTRAAFPGAGAAPVSIGGERGYRIGVSEASYVMPLAALAITWHDGHAYLFMEHLLFDGRPSGDFGAILAAVSFD